LPRKAAATFLVLLYGFFPAAGARGQGQSSGAEEPGANVISPRLCFVLKIPGRWVPGNEPGTYRSPDGKEFVGVVELTAQDLKRSKGSSLVEKESAALEQAYNKALRKKLTDVKLSPFDSSVPGTWKWTATLPKDAEHGFHSPKRYIIELGPEGIVVLNVQETPDDDDLARRIISMLRHSKDKPCRLPSSLSQVSNDSFKSTAQQTTPPSPGEGEFARSRVYANPKFPWTIAYPAAWELEASDPGEIRIHRAAEGVQVGCAIFSVAVQFQTVEEFADFWLRQSYEHMSSQGYKVRRWSRERILLPNGITGLDVMSDNSAGGRAREIFVLANSVGYLISCETSIHYWKTLASHFDKIINSFKLATNS
jgi:hypothetical protein